MALPDTTEKQPSYSGVYFYAVLMALSGGLLGFFYLVSFPAQAFDSQEEYEAARVQLKEAEGIVYSKPGDAYYVEGPILRTRSWEAKRQQLMISGPQTVSISAGEINGWMSAKFRISEPKKGGDESGMLIIPGVPNVGLVDGEGFFVNVPVNIEAYGYSGEYGVYLFGNIDSSGFKIKSLKISSAKVPLPNILGKQILNTLAAGYKNSEEYGIISKAFERIESAMVKEGQLAIVLR